MPRGQFRGPVTKEIRERLKTGNLFSLEELRDAMQHVVRSIGVDAKKDFEQLFHLESVYKDLFATEQPTLSGPSLVRSNEEYTSTIQKTVEQLEVGVNTSMRGSRSGAGYQEVVIELHRALLKLTSTALAQRQDRQAVIEAMFSDLESRGVSRDKLPEPLPLQL
ncbi:hypothetical protein KIPB_005041 [Kipferlia bialata]|uniref:Uncharacterized protein n=1 Tax=Kipferlia bialata TaxID=797122 RepID=A0A9K3GIM0_9EUKA|nr:hypothetical protein KIPB_005041 [Kipferlia bialata]|eukprot:g5041.t1